MYSRFLRSLSSCRHTKYLFLKLNSWLNSSRAGVRTWWKSVHDILFYIFTILEHLNQILIKYSTPCLIPWLQWQYRILILNTPRWDQTNSPLSLSVVVLVWMGRKTSLLTWCIPISELTMREKNTIVGRICVLSDRNKRLLARSLLLF